MELDGFPPGAGAEGQFSKLVLLSVHGHQAVTDSNEITPYSLTQHGQEVRILPTPVTSAVKHMHKYHCPTIAKNWQAVLVVKIRSQFIYIC